MLGSFSLFILFLGNPLNCDCQLIGLWEWLQDHSRLLSSQEKNLVCVEPDKINDRSFLSLHPVDFCPVPLILILEVFKLESNEMTLHWEVQNNSLVAGFKFNYHLTSDRVPIVSNKQLSPLERYIDISDLKSETWYTVCLEVEGKYSRKTSNKPAAYVMSNQRNFEYTSNNRKCLQVC